MVLTNDSQGRNRKILLRGQSHFSLFFPDVKCFFPVENFHFGWPKTNFSEKWKAKQTKQNIKTKKKQTNKQTNKNKTKKKSSPHFVTFPLSIFNFPPSLLQFSFFSSQFSHLFPFLLDFFPRSEVSGGTLPPCPSPRLLRHCWQCTNVCAILHPYKSASWYVIVHSY